MENKLGIYICSHKSFTPHVKNDSGCFRIAFPREEFSKEENFETITCKIDTPLDDRFYSEIYMMKYLVDNKELPEYVGICHYRRYWGCFDDVKQLIDDMEKNDIIIPNLKFFPTTIKQQYQACHNIEDLEIIRKIINEKYPEYIDAYNKFTEGNIFIPFNMYIMKREDFKDCVNFIWNVLQDYVNVVGTDIYQRINNKRQNYIKTFSPNNTAEYQYRIGGYLGERLTNIFIMANIGKRFNKVKERKIEVVESKYGKKF